jgi:type II secretory pathway pseudopilin PulG
MHREEKNMRSVAAFTILEVVIVLSIMSVLITIIAVASNRFQEQLKQTSVIQESLNRFYALRSELWYELYTSDSIVVASDQTHIYMPERIVSYKISDDTLYQFNQQTWQSMHVAMLGITTQNENEAQKITFQFDWKDAPMELCYYSQNGLKQKMDDFFEHYTR